VFEPGLDNFVTSLAGSVFAGGQTLVPVVCCVVCVVCWDTVLVVCCVSEEKLLFVLIDVVVDSVEPETKIRLS